MDFIAPVVPIGLGAGRIGNFINGELWGKVSDLPWAMRIPCVNPRFTGSEYCQQMVHGYSLPRQPTQLYEFLLEGVVMFAVLWVFSMKPRPRMAVSGLFVALYGCFRFLVEFVRMPDPQFGYLAFGWVTMGQILSLPLIIMGIVLLVLAYRRGVCGSRMMQYLELMRQVRDHGARKSDRTGTGTLSVFGYQMRFDLSEGFPGGHHQETAFPLHHPRTAVVPEGRDQHSISAGERRQHLGRMGRCERGSGAGVWLPMAFLAGAGWPAYRPDLQGTGTALHHAWIRGASS